MIRRTALAVAAGLVTGLLMASATQAASPLTIKCTRAEATKLRTCISDCRSQFRSGRAACFGPGLQCALACSNQSDTCLVPVNTSLRTCNDTCASVQRDTIDICRSQFQNGVITEAQLDSCANQARLSNLECRLACTDGVDEARLGCSQTLSGCLASCASCATPNECPPQQ